MKKYFAFLFLVLSFTGNAQDKVWLLSWNIRDFGKTKSAETIMYVASIVKDYDIIALQEVVSGYGGSQAVARLADELNRSWGKMELYS